MFRILAALVFLGVFSIDAQAALYPVTPCATPTSTCFHVSDNTNLGASDVEGIVGASMLELYYKKDYDSEHVDTGPESGSFTGSYDTSFLYDSGGPIGANISYTGGDKISCPDCYLVVKDGSQGNPAQYIFDIGDWDGMMTLALSGFWDGDGVQGAISNVAIWGKVSAVPVPAAIWLFGTALFGFIGFSRRTQI